jgi:hypothetical protein
MGVTLSMVPVMLFPIIKKQNEVLALGVCCFQGVAHLNSRAGKILPDLVQEFGAAQLG